MAPSPVQDRYALYKSGTARLVQWLASQAGRCCDLTAIVTSFKNEAKLGKISTETATGLVYVTLTTKEFVRLAEIIVCSETPQITVPFRIVDLAREIIAGRQLCADWYECRDAPEHSRIDEANKSHKHFIGVLEKVYGLLRGAYYKARGLNKKQYKKLEKTQSKAHSLSNLFALLEVEEPSISPLGDAPSLSPVHKTPSTPSTKATFRLEQPEDDAYLVVWCFLEDMKDIRSFIRGTWRDSRDGRVSRLNASMVTAAAFDMMYHLQVQLHSKLHSKHVMLVEYFDLIAHLDICVGSEGTTIIALPNDPAQSGHCDKLGSIVNLICLAGYFTLRRFQDKGKEFNAHKKKFGVEGKKLPYTMAENTHDFSQAMDSIIPEMFALKRDDSPFLSGDRFMASLFDFPSAGPDHVKVWMASACESYMDIYDIVGDMAKEGLDELRTASPIARETLSKIAKFEKENRNWTHSWKPDPHFEACLHSIENFIEKDWLRDAVEDEAITPYRLVSALPVLPAEIHDHLRLSMHNFGVKNCNNGAIVLTAAHLYSAARAQGIITKQWEDMDFVISEQNKQIEDHRKLMVDYPPNAGAVTAAKHFSMALGMKATEINGDKPPFPGFRRVLKKCRQFGITSVFLCMAARKCVEVADPYGDKTDLLGQVMHALLEKEGSLKQGITSDTGPNKTGKYHPCLLLSKFRDCMEGDQSHVSFDYNSFFLRCVEILGTLATHFSMPLDTRPHVQNFYDILWDAALAERRHAQKESTLLFHVGKHLESLFAQNGDVGKRGSIVMSGGFPHPRPAPPIPRKVLKIPDTARASLRVSQRQEISVCWLANGSIDDMVEILYGNRTPGSKMFLQHFGIPGKVREQKEREIRAAYQKKAPNVRLVVKARAEV